MKKHLVIIIAILLNACSGGQKVINCPPKRIYYKHPEKFYPDAIKTTNITVSNAINVLNKLKDSGSVIITQKAQALKEQLNQFGSLNSELIKSSFINSNSHPCDIDASLKFSELIAKISDQNFQIQNIANSLTKPLNTETKKILLDSLKNAAPIADAGKNQIIQLPNTSVELKGTSK
jgi:hypothetical protein